MDTQKTLDLIRAKEAQAQLNRNQAVRIRGGYYFIFATAYDALLEVERIDFVEPEWQLRVGEWVLRYHAKFAGESIQVFATLTEAVAHITEAANFEVETIDRQLAHYDDEISPFGISTTFDESVYTSEPEPLENESPLELSAPVDTVVTARILTAAGGINGKTTLEILAANDSRVIVGSVIESHLVGGYSVGSALECRASVFSIFGTTSIEIMEVLNNSKLAAPVAAIVLGTTTATIRIVNPNGKFEILESSSSNLIPVGKTYNSTLTTYRPLGSLWIVNCHLSRGDSGSLKIDSIEAFERATVISAPVAAIPVPVPVISSPVAPVAPVATLPVPLESSASVEVAHAPVLEPEPDRTIIASIEEWVLSDYYVSPNARLVFGTAISCLKKNSHNSVKVLMTGDPGYGKTTIAEKFAAFLGFTCYRMNCAAIRDTEEWFFDREVKTVNGELNTVFTDSDFVEVLRRGNCVMILDEFNRLESNLHNSLFPLLDDSGSTRLHHKDYIAGPNVIFVATVNLGRDNSGTFLLDDALTNRFDMILEVRPLPYDHEIAVLQARYGIEDDQADQIVRLATLLRENEFKCSTRDTLKIAKLVSVGMAIRDAFEFVIVLRIPEDEQNAPIRKALVDLVNKNLGTRGVEFAMESPV